MKKYVYQKFLLNCNYEDVNLDNYEHSKRNLELIPEYGQDYCLFDVGNEVVRKIKLTQLDDIIDTEEDWEVFIESLNNIDVLILLETDKEYGNIIIQNYRLATFKAYLKRFEKVKIELS